MKFINKNILVFLISSTVLITGCLVTNFKLKEGVNLNTYTYVFINPVKSSDGTEDTYGAAELLSNIFKSEKLVVLNEKEVKQLSKDDSLKVLFCNTKYVYAQDEWGDNGTTVTVALCDSTGGEFYVGKSRRDGINIKQGIAFGVKAALRGFMEAYTKYDPTVAAEAVDSSGDKGGAEKPKKDPAGAKDADQKEMPADSNAVFSGSGFIISNKGLVVTNYHAVEGAKKIEVFLPKLNKSFSASVALKDRKNNLAILRLDNFSAEKGIPFSIKKGGADQGRS
jgi:S1-C subfamily serine protease